jgi:hypothetical protein
MLCDIYILNVKETNSNPAFIWLDKRYSCCMLGGDEYLRLSLSHMFVFKCAKTKPQGFCGIAPPHKSLPKERRRPRIRAETISKHQELLSGSMINMNYAVRGAHSEMTRIGFKAHKIECDAWCSPKQATLAT